MDWARMLAYITGTVDQELLLRNEYLACPSRKLIAVGFFRFEHLKPFGSCRLFPL